MKQKIVSLLVISMMCIGLIGCETKKQEKDYQFSDTLFSSLEKTVKIDIKQNINGVDTTLGTIDDLEEIKSLLSLVKNSKTEDNCNDIGTGWSFVMYNDSDFVIETFLVWPTSNGILPLGVNEKCPYVLNTSSNNLMAIIEEKTDTKFFTIHDYSTVCAEALELIYEDDNYKYYFNCIKSDQVFITFSVTGQNVTVKEALEKGYISASKLLEKLPDFLIKEEK